MDCPTEPPFQTVAMKSHIQSVWNDMSQAEWELQAAEREYASYVQKAAWSDDICARVEFLKVYIEDVKAEIQSLQTQLSALQS